MNLTKTNAGVLMCPFQQHPEKTLNCISNRCMAWEWISQRQATQPTLKQHYSQDGEPERPKHVPASWQFEFAEDSDDGVSSWVEPKWEAMTHWRGRCRLIERGQE